MQELNGYVKLYRKLIQWGWYQDNVVKSLFLHCLLMASFKDFSWKGNQLKAGQFITSYKSLADELGFTVQQVRTAIKKLESTEEITSKSTNKFTVITVLNWDNYQIDDTDSNTVINNQITNNQQTNNNQITNNQQHRKNVKNVKKSKNVKNSSSAAAPQLSDILNFIAEKSLNVDGEKFFLHYSKNNWVTKDGKPITDWKSLLQNWSDTEKKDPVTYPGGYGNVKYLGED